MAGGERLVSLHFVDIVGELNRYSLLIAVTIRVV